VLGEPANDSSRLSDRNHGRQTRQAAVAAEPATTIARPGVRRFSNSSIPITTTRKGRIMGCEDNPRPSRTPISAARTGVTLGVQSSATTRKGSRSVNWSHARRAQKNWYADDAAKRSRTAQPHVPM
jgi:hypothetical protein